MGAPKQKWTSEEEAALKAGVIKHGAGKWRTILKDPEFAGVLSLRSNVDLKDKWRNLSVMANGWGSREKARLALRRGHHQSLKHEENTLAIERGVQSDEEMIDAKPLAVSNGLLQIAGPKRSLPRMESLILEAVTSLKEPSGSNKTAISMYIEDQYDAPPNLNMILSACLKGLTASGKLIKVNRNYRITPSGAFSEARRSSTMPVLVGRQQDFRRMEVTKSQIDAELAKMRTMTPQEAAAAAARAVAEAEAAIAEAEQAAREAEEAEADAEAAQAFAEAAMTTLKTRNTPSLIVHS